MKYFCYFCARLRGLITEGKVCVTMCNECGKNTICYEYWRDQ